MPFRSKARSARNIASYLIDALFKLWRNLDVVDRSAARTHQVVVMISEILCQFIMNELARRNDPVDDSCLLQYREIPICRADSERRIGQSDVRNRERTPRIGQDHKQRLTISRQTLTDLIQALHHLFVQGRFQRALDYHGRPLRPARRAGRILNAVPILAPR